MVSATEAASYASMPSARAISSALMNRSPACLTNTSWKVDLPAPFGPAMATMTGRASNGWLTSAWIGRREHALDEAAHRTGAVFLDLHEQAWPIGGRLEVRERAGLQVSRKPLAALGSLY